MMAANELKYKQKYEYDISQLIIQHLEESSENDRRAAEKKDSRLRSSVNKPNRIIISLFLFSCFIFFSEKY